MEIQQVNLQEVIQGNLNLDLKEKIYLNLSDVAKAVKSQLKKEFSECKFSISTEKYSMGQSLHIHLMEGPFKAVYLLKKVYNEDGNFIYIDEELEEQKCQVNPYSFDSYLDRDIYRMNVTEEEKLTFECVNVLERAYELVQLFNYDKSEPMSDYFEVNFYVHMNVGKWNKSYKQI